MYEIIFYEDKDGNSPVRDYLNSLALKSDKDSRVKLNSIRNHLLRLKTAGTRCGSPYVKHIDGEIWELRPLRDRILFAAWIDNSFVLLHQFVKDTQKTPPREIDKAKRELADFKERSRLK